MTLREWITERPPHGAGGFIRLHQRRSLSIERKVYGGGRFWVRVYVGPFALMFRVWHRQSWE